MQAILYTLIPLAAVVIGALATVVRRPSMGFQAGVQHLAAGVVFAAAAGEILPDLKHSSALLPVLLGAAVGIAGMLALKSATERRGVSTGLALTAGIDLLVDGLVLGISFVAGMQQGILLAIALTLEVLFLGLSLAGTLADSMSKMRAVVLTCAIGLALPLGALLGAPVSALPEAWQTGFYAFGLIALLYLVTEELLVEAHERPESPLTTSMFFIGFMAILTIEELMQ